MRYWPMSVIADSPLMPPPHSIELRLMNRRAPSEAAYHACFEVARQTRAAPIHGLAFIESVGAPGRQVFTEHPSGDDWARLERVAVVDHDGYFFIIIDAMH